MRMHRLILGVAAVSPRVLVARTAAGSGGHFSTVATRPKPAVPHESTVRFFPHSLGAEAVLQDVWDEGELDESFQILYVTRHGETAMNVAGCMQGRGINAHLNDNGEAQAQALGQYLKHVPLYIVSSSLHRAHQTALAVAEQNECEEAPFRLEAKPVLQLEGLDELSWGWMEGEPKDKEPVRSKLKQLLKSWSSGDLGAAAASGGDSPKAVLERSTAAVAAILQRGHRHNLVVTHGRTMRILLLGLAGLPVADMDHFGSVPNTGLYVFAARGGRFRMLYPQPKCLGGGGAAAAADCESVPHTQ